MRTLGIDIGGTSVKAACWDGRSFRVSMSAEYARPDRATLVGAIHEALSQLHAGPVNAIGLCVPGRRAPDGGSIDLAVNVPGLVGYRFDDLLRDAGGGRGPVTLLSDAGAATLDAARDYPEKRRILGVALGTGVGVALVEDGAPLGIGRGSIGHLGQIDVGPIGVSSDGSPIRGPDGGRDSLEGYLGARALRARFGPELGAALAGLDRSDPAFVALVRALRISLAIYAPDQILLLGGVGLALGPAGERIRQAVSEGLTSLAPQGWSLGFAGDRHHAARGACRAAWATLTP